MSSELVLTVLWASIIAIAALYDLKYRRIPNVLSVLSWGLGAARFFMVYGWDEWPMSVWAFLATFTLGLLLTLMQILGAGDVKLMMGAALGIGLEDWPMVVFVTFALGAVIAVFRLVQKRNFLDFLQRLGFVFQGRFQPALELLDGKDRFPFGICILGGVLWYLAN